MPSDLEVAHHLATLANRVAMPFFEGENETWLKSDGSPVGQADLAVEAALVVELARLRPDDGVLSEEEAEFAGATTRRWILDPVDGTYEFVEGLSGWGTNIALEIRGEVVLGLVTRPRLSRRWWATRGEGAHGATDDDGLLGSATRCAVSARERATARVTGWPEEGEDGARARLTSFGTWVGSGMSILSQLLAGDLDAVLGLRAGPWDFAPGVVLIEEAGGSFCDLDGGRSIHLGAALFTNGVIETELRAHLGIPSPR